MYLGAHMSTSGGLYRAIEHAVAVDSNAVQIFVKNNNRWMEKPLADKDIQKFNRTLGNSQVKKVVAHIGYLVNLANDGENWQKSMESMESEMVRCDQISVPYLVMHPGSHLGKGEEFGLKRIAESLNEQMAKREYAVMPLLETTAGQGTNLGYRFEHLRDILGMLDAPEQFGVCVDTCHIFAAGYEIRTQDAYEKTFDEFDRIIGIGKIKAFHLNDSKMDFASKRDRHEHIGQGKIGVDAFKFLLNDRRFKDIPMVLETPKEPDLEADRHNLSLLKSLITEQPEHGTA